MTKHSKSLEWFGYALIFSAIVGLDQLSKALIYQHLREADIVDLWPGVFRLNYEENTGAAFSMLSGQTWIFILLTLILSAIIIYALFRGYIRTLLGRVSLVCVVSGGIGNLIDRVFRGFVVDMFDFYLIDFAVFNVADVFVCCGCALFILLFVITKGEILE